MDRLAGYSDDLPSRPDMVSRKVTDLVTLYYDERKYRTELIENERKTMQEILSRVQSSQMKIVSDGLEEEDDLGDTLSLLSLCL